ncbi:ImmA/IrrE family metallo-endopeptidase [Microbacteriaceae bacterium VKM Ac-2855]|nr:ImmA/IrrE family metallo-endopeptidase [Microbacteriaceae bacterium VKM Ac-2855]
MRNDPATYGIGATSNSIRAYAERIGESHGIYDGNGRANIEGLVRDLGGIIEPRDGSESLIVREKGNFKVFIPFFTSERRDRFTVAHELGHYFLHYRFVQEHKEYGEPAQVFNRGGRGRAETEANTFAASLLMPERQFRDAYRDLGGDAFDLADRFDVSPASARVRCAVLFPNG